MLSHTCDNQNTYLVTLSSLFISPTVYPKKYAHGFCFAVLCCGYTLTDFPISIRLTSLALWQSNDCPSASKATLMNTDKYFMWIHYERLHNHNKAKHNKTVCIFLGIYCTVLCVFWSLLCVVFFRLACEPLNITFIIGRSRHNPSAVTPVKYECNAKNLGTLAGSKLLFTEKLSCNENITNSWGRDHCY